MKIKVKPNSSLEKIEEKQGYFLVYLKKPAREGKANEELLKLLKKHFKKSFRIIKGFKSREKIVEEI